MHNEAKELKAALQQIGCTVVYYKDDSLLDVSYTYNRALQKQVVQLLNTYVGFWKSVALKTTLEKLTQEVMYEIPLHFITKKDVPINKLKQVIDSVTNQVNLTHSC
jgi:hypothetical protein